MATLSDLKLDTRNARRRGQRASGLLEASLQEVGAARSIVIDEHNRILAGNGTVEAAGQVGIDRVQIVEADGETIVAVRRRGLTEAQKQRLALLDNRTADLAEWDPQVLAALVDEGLQMGDLWSNEELEAMIAADGVPVEPGDGGDEFDTTPDEGPTRCQPGDLWLLGPHRLVCGDCTDAEVVARVMGGKRADCCLTDPPYCSGGFQESGKKAGSIGTRDEEMIANDTLSTRGYMALIRRVLHVGKCGVIYLFTDWRMWISLFDVVESSGYGVRNMIVWDKGSPGMGQGWRSQHELILCGVKATRPFDPHKAQGNVIGCNRTGNVNHATEKPVDLMSRILDVTDTAKLVYDPFLGSGTTLIAAHRLGRVCYGCEIEPRYCDVILRRYEAETGEKATRAD